MPRGERERRYSPTETPQDRVQAAVEQLEHGIDSILGGEQYAAYLRTVARFHSYNFGNVLFLWTKSSERTMWNRSLSGGAPFNRAAALDPSDDRRRHVLHSIEIAFQNRAVLGPAGNVGE